MKYVIAHECRGRIRIRIDQKHMSLAQADLLGGLGCSALMAYSRPSSMSEPAAP